MQVHTLAKEANKKKSPQIEFFYEDRKIYF